jgi:hypothetical protein
VSLPILRLTISPPGGGSMTASVDVSLPILRVTVSSPGDVAG